MSAASASPYYQPVASIRSSGVQRFTIRTGYVLVDIRRDRYTVVQPESTSSTSSRFELSSGTVGAATASPATAQAYAAALVASRGWGAAQFTCLVELWNQESSWNMFAENTSSGAYGIPQALPGEKMGAGWQNNYRVQINWGLTYIAAVYGSPCGAWSSEVSRGSY